MKFRIITAFFTALFLVTIATPVITQNTEQLFQKGIMKEEGEGNLPEAIEIFNSIVEDPMKMMPSRQKHCCMWDCFTKSWEKRSFRAYQKLMNNLPSRKNEVAIARERLSRLILETEKLTIKCK